MDETKETYHFVYFEEKHHFHLDQPTPGSWNICAVNLKRNEILYCFDCGECCLDFSDPFVETCRENLEEYLKTLQRVLTEANENPKLYTPDGDFVEPYKERGAP
jgi:hypothetical protein